MSGLTHGCRIVRIPRVVECVHCGEALRRGDVYPAATTRVLGPTCWDCWLRLPTHVHLWALDFEKRGGRS